MHRTHPSLIYLAFCTMSSWTLVKGLLVPNARHYLVRSRVSAGGILPSSLRRTSFAPTWLRSYNTSDQISENEAPISNSTDYTGARAPNAPLPQNDASSILAIDPVDIAIVRVNSTAEVKNETAASDADLLKRLPFVKMFRGSANYIANHRGTLAVYHLPGGLLDLPDPSIFRDLMNDIALTWLLGMHVVLVAGCRHQVSKRLAAMEADVHANQGLRVTDAQTLRVVKEEAGYVRFEVERQLARSLRLQGAGGAAGMGHYDGNVVSGNFYSAQPFGILDGVDYA